MFPRVFRLIFNKFYVWKICATQLDPIYCTWPPKSQLEKLKVHKNGTVGKIYTQYFRFSKKICQYREFRAGTGPDYYLFHKFWKSFPAFRFPKKIGKFGKNFPKLSTDHLQESFPDRLSR